MRNSAYRHLESWQYPLTIGALVFVAALLGISSRPVDSLATFWPANALLLGVFVRWPHYVTWSGWVTAFVGFFLADLITGGPPILTIWLTLSNLSGVAVGVIAYRRFGNDDRKLQRPGSLLVLFAVSVVAALGAAGVGAGTAPQTLGSDWQMGLVYWFATEFANYLVILPTVLVMPGFAAIRARLVSKSWTPVDSLRNLAPVGALIASAVASAIIAGPGAISFPVPALLWIGLRYGLPATSIATMAVGIFEMVAMSFGWLEIPAASDSVRQVVSIRIGVSLLALGPLTVASIAEAYRTAIRQLEDIANHDSLTGALTRRSFMVRAESLLRQIEDDRLALSVLMIDLDHFKLVNDEHGHDIGDRVLARSAAAIRGALPASTLICRLGGEEFSVLIPGLTQHEAHTHAARIQAALRVSNGQSMGTPLPTITASIGAVHLPTISDISLRSLLARADRALYTAKINGRDRIEWDSVSVP